MQTRLGKITDWAAALLLLCTGGGVSGYGVWHYAGGVIAARDAALAEVSAKLEQAGFDMLAERAAVSAAWHRWSAAERQLAKTEEALKSALAAQAGNEELVKAVKDLTGKIKIAPAKVQNPAGKPRVDAPAVPAPVPAPAPAKPVPKKVEPQAVAGVDPAEMVAAHNRWRSEVGVPDLRWSDELAAVAQGWADHLAGNNCAMYHSGNGLGENIYQASALMWPDGHREFRAVPSLRPVDAWGEEKQWYNAETGKCYATGKTTCGHYTQAVWKDTKEVGCAMAICGNNAQIWVCNYSPAGNIVGQKPF
jgi:pathogenesis-related protein 1